jgi:hypothetical protein
MKKLLGLLSLLLCSFLKANSQIESLVVNKYWQYSNTVYDKAAKHVYNFRAIPGVDSIKEVALYFSKNGNFKEVVNAKTHPKPARSGKWQVNKDTLVLDFPNQRWNYKILFMNAKEFQCTMSK